jgi:hypothetical protein
MYLLKVGLGFGFGVLCAPAQLVSVTPLHVFLLCCVWSTRYVRIGRFTFLVICNWSRYWISSHIVNVVVVDLVQMFSFS